MFKSVEERFWEKVDQSGDCWLWTAAVDRGTGYGRFGDGNGRVVLSHRFVYELEREMIPPGMQIDHVCHQKLCVNPAHLRLATNKQNMENRNGPDSNNTSGVRGVCWDKANKKWIAYVKHNGKKYHVGRFKTIEEAEVAVVGVRNRLFTHNDMDRGELGFLTPKSKRT